MQSRIRSVLTFLIGWPLSIFALVFLSRAFLSRTSAIGSNISHIDWLLLSLGFFCLIGYYLVRSYLWYKLLEYAGYKLDPFDSLFNWLFAQLKRYLPGNVWGVLGVSVHFAKKDVPKKVVASTVIIETELVVLSASILSLLGLPVLLTLFPPDALQRSLLQIVEYLVILGTIVYFLAPVLGKRLRLLKKTPLQLLPSFSIEKVIAAWSLMTLSFLLYGIGTLLVIASFVYIDPHNTWGLVGFFILSLLVGFLSFITPTGLGVREGAMTLGLATFIPTALAAFASVFARLILIIAEVTAILAAYLLTRVRQRYWTQSVTWIRKNPHLAMLFVVYCIFVLYFAWISMLRYDNFYAGRFDLGNMDQTVWNSLHGRIFEFTNPNGTNIVTRLSFHADFILVLLAPFYALWQDPRMLLFIQALIVGIGAFFVYGISQFILKNKTFSLIFACLYLLNPSLERSVIYDFHAVTLATTFLLGAVFFLIKRQYKWFILFAVLAGITKEQIWAVTGLMGLYIFFAHKKRLIGVVVFSLSLLIFYVLLWHLIPLASGSAHFALSYYSNGEVTDSPTSLIKLYLLSPDKTYGLVTDSARISYLIKLFAPLGYLSLLSPLFLVFAGPDLLINLLSTRPQLYQIYYQYTAVITPFLFVSAIFGLSFLKKILPKIPQIAVVMYLVVVGLYTAYLYGPLPGAKEANLDMVTKSMPNKLAINQLLHSIPSQYSVATSNSLGSHVTHRAYLFTMPFGWDNADYIIFSLHESDPSPSLQAHKEQIKKLESSEQYVKYYDDGLIKAFRKKSISANSGAETL